MRLTTPLMSSLVFSVKASYTLLRSASRMP